MHRSFCLLLIGLLMTFPVSAADSQVLSLDETARLAVAYQPQLDVYDHASAAAREAAIAEAQLPDPVLKLGAQSVPITGSDALRFDRDDMTMSTIGVMQEMVRPEKRQAAANRMQAESEQWRLERAAEVRQVIRDAKLAWIDAYETALRSTLYGRIAAELAAERKVASQKIATGAVATSEIFQLDTMLAGMNDRRIAAENASARARAQLSRWLGNAAFRPLPEALSDETEALMRSASPADISLENHPQLAVRRQAEQVASFEAQRARADRKPDWSWEVMYGHRLEDRADLVSFQIAVPLQLDQAKRQDRRLAEKLALTERARSVTLDQERQLRADLLAVRADSKAAQARLLEHEERLIPAARARLQLATAGYAAGTLPLSAVWEARRGAIDAENEHVMIEAELLRTAIRHEYLTGNTP